MRTLVAELVSALLVIAPGAMAVQPGDLLASNLDTGEVLNIRDGGDFSGAAPFATGIFGGVLCLGPGGDVYAVDQNTETVKIITAGGDLSGAPSFASGIMIRSLTCSDSEILASNTAGEVYDITGGGDFSAVAPVAHNLGVGQFLGLYRDSGGTLWVARSVDGDVVDITAGGDFGGAVPFAFNGNVPTAITERGGFLLVATRSDGRVIDFTAGGDLAVLSTFATVPDVVDLLDAGSPLFAASRNPDGVFEISFGGDFTGAMPFAFGFEPFLNSGMVFVPGCGDGNLDPATEECDDGNTVNGDGCNLDCQITLCTAAPLMACTAATRGRLSADEKKTGREKLKAKLTKFESALMVGELGDPVAGTTRFDVCVYDATDALVGELTVDRAGEPCGVKQKPCWKDRGGKGFDYKDPDATASGVRKLSARSGDAGKGKVQVDAANKEKKDQLALPTGIAAALNGALQARVQVVNDAGGCLEAVFPTVRKADGVRFKAKTP